MVLKYTLEILKKKKAQILLSEKTLRKKSNDGTTVPLVIKIFLKPQWLKQYGIDFMNIQMDQWNRF